MISVFEVYVCILSVFVCLCVEGVFLHMDVIDQHTGQQLNVVLITLSINKQ